MPGTIAETAEFLQLARLRELAAGRVTVHTLADLHYRQQRFALDAFELGSPRPDMPVLVFVGGVHGVERIGAQVVLAFLENLLQRLAWDDSLHSLLQQMRLWFVPIVNPVGLALCRRSNGNHVDLMRNAPVDATGPVTPLVGGQRLTRLLPWYRGRDGVLEPEAGALLTLVMTELARAPLVMTLDVHSGFGLRDRLWFPLASSRQPIAHLAEMYGLFELLGRSYPHHDYLFEPQSAHYLTHGDLWDYAYLQGRHSASLLLPLTLEMGSWRWLKKNPRQLGRLGLFNPVKPHRQQRVLRRHLSLMEFLIRATLSWRNWVPDGQQRLANQQQALKLWYPEYD